jgi:hypothetical protein
MTSPHREPRRADRRSWLLIALVVLAFLAAHRVFRTDDGRPIAATAGEAEDRAGVDTVPADVIDDADGGARDAAGAS